MPAEQRAGLGGRVELAYARGQYGPGHAAREAERVVVEATPQRPELDHAQRGAEVRDVGHEAQQRAGDARAW